MKGLGPGYFAAAGGLESLQASRLEARGKARVFGEDPLLKCFEAPGIRIMGHKIDYKGKPICPSCGRRLMRIRGDLKHPTGN
jgi:hypothetical protein